MITAYQWYVAAHVLAAVVWVGGAAMTQALALRATRTGESLRIAGFAKDMEWIGMRVFLPASIVLLLFGVLAVHEGGWGFGEPWISIGMSVWILSFLTGMLFYGPESGRIARVTAERGADSPEAQARIRRIFLISRIELVLLLFTVFSMAVKLGT